MDQSKRKKKITLKLLIEDEAKNKALKTHITGLGDKLQQMLLWSNICALWSYVILIVMIARLYNHFEGQHRALMICSLGAMYVFLAILFIVAWKNSAGKQGDLKKISNNSLNYHISVLARQCKMHTVYLIMYTVLISVASVFFFRDIHNGLTLILKLTAPVSTAAYLLGLYFIIKFKRQQHQLNWLNRGINHLAIVNDEQ